MPVFLFSETAAQPGFDPPRSLRTQPAKPKLHSIPSPSLWASENLHFLPDPSQTAILDSSASRVLLCCSRQWGKSTVTAIRALHYAWFHPGSLIVVVAPVLRQSRTFLHKIRTLLGRLGVSPRRDPRAGSGDALSLLLPNGSAILGLPASDATTRGLSAVHFLILDEAARIPDPVYHAVRPFLATTSGLLWLLSTPHGESGFFYDEWHSSGSSWARFSVSAADCLRIASAFLEEERRALGPHAFAQEYLCHFLPSRYQLVPRAVIDRAVTATEQPLDTSRLFSGN